MPYDCDTIAAEIFTIFENDSNLKTFEIVPQPDARNSSPVMHVLHHLGLESWCVKDLYCFSHQRICISTEVKSRIKHLNVLLLLNPNVKTYWNARKELVKNEDLNPHAELNFVGVILSYKPKAQDAYNHRKWLLSKIFECEETSSELFTKELEIIHNAACQHVNNHMAWNFATWCLDYVKEGSVLQTFWETSEKWVSVNISDYSGMYFRQRVLLKLIALETQVDGNFKNEIVVSGLNYLSSVFGKYEYGRFDENIIDKLFSVCLIIVELEQNEKLINFYGNYESLWNHRRFLGYFFTKIMPVKMSEDGVKLLIGITVGDSNIQNDVSIILKKIDGFFFKNIANGVCDKRISQYNRWMNHFLVHSNP